MATETVERTEQDQAAADAAARKAAQKADEKAAAKAKREQEQAATRERKAQEAAAKKEAAETKKREREDAKAAKRAEVEQRKAERAAAPKKVPLTLSQRKHLIRLSKAGTKGAEVTTDMGRQPYEHFVANGLAERGETGTEGATAYRVTDAGKARAKELNAKYAD